jgi:hypothetical protein
MKFAIPRPQHSIHGGVDAMLLQHKPKRHIEPITLHKPLIPTDKTDFSNPDKPKILPEVTITGVKKTLQDLHRKYDLRWLLLIPAFILLRFIYKKLTKKKYYSQRQVRRY